jgi:GT2 family glycosyltransferase
VAWLGGVGVAFNIFYIDFEKAVIDFGIVNYNGGSSLAKCVKSIQKLQNVETRIFIYDNNSQDNSLNGLDNGAYIERSEKNLGYAGACNALLRKMDSAIQVLCNMDLEFDQNWGKEILAAFENNKDCGSVASLVMEKNGAVNSIGVEFYPDMHATNEGSGKSINEMGQLKGKQVFGCYGAVMAFRKEAAQEVGFLEDSFFLFFEETEWYLRHNLLNFSTAFCPSAIVLHERSKTTVRYSPLKLFYGERNRIRAAFHYLPIAYLPKLPFYSFKRYLKMQREVKANSSSGKKYSKFYLCFVLLKAWISGIFGEKPKFKLTGKSRKRILEIIKKYEINSLAN